MARSYWATPAPRRPVQSRCPGLSSRAHMCFIPWPLEDSSSTSSCFPPPLHPNTSFPCKRQKRTSKGQHLLQSPPPPDLSSSSLPSPAVQQDFCLLPPTSSNASQTCPKRRAAWAPLTPTSVKDAVVLLKAGPQTHSIGILSPALDLLSQNLPL